MKPHSIHRPLAGLNLALQLLIFSAMLPAQAQTVVCAPTATPSPAILNQNVTFRGNCAVGGLTPLDGLEVWTLPVDGGGTTTLLRPLRAPPLVVSFATAGPKALTVQFEQTSRSAPFALLLQVQTSSTAVASRLAQLATPQQQAAQTAIRAQLSTVSNRLRTLRMQSSSLLLTPQSTVSTTGQGATADAADGSKPPDATGTTGLGVYMAGNYERGRQQSADGTGGFVTRTAGATAGADYRLTTAWALGATLGLLDTQTRSSSDAGQQHAKSRSATAYASWTPSAKLYVDAALALERGRYEIKRDDTGGDIAYARTRSSGSGFTVAAGYDLHIGAWALSPYGRAELVQLKIDPFSEFNSVNALQVGMQRVKAGTATLGGQAQLSVGQAWGVITPYARLELTRLIENRQDAVSARLLNSQTVLLVDKPAGPVDRSAGRLALGAAAQLHRGVSMFVDAEAGFGQAHYRVWRVNGGAKVEL